MLSANETREKFFQVFVDFLLNSYSRNYFYCDPFSRAIDHFRVHLSLHFKSRLSAKSLL